MRGPSLQKTTLLSFALHLTVFIVAFFMLKQSNRIVIPTPYTVNLVSPEVLMDVNRGSTTIIESSRHSLKGSPINKISKKKIKQKPKIKKENKKSREIIEEKISLIAAKKRIEKFVKLRSMISLQAGKKNINGHSRSTLSNETKGSVFDNYYEKITREIWQQWIWTDIGEKDLEAIISIRILKDGSIHVNKIEKSSGNQLFDKSAIRALTKASPLPPPPYEMEIGVRFYP